MMMPFNEGMQVVECKHRHQIGTGFKSRRKHKTIPLCIYFTVCYTPSNLSKFSSINI